MIESLRDNHYIIAGDPRIITAQVMQELASRYSPIIISEAKPDPNAPADATPYDDLHAYVRPIEATILDLTTLSPAEIALVISTLDGLSIPADCFGIIAIVATMPPVSPHSRVLVASHP